MPKLPNIYPLQNGTYRASVSLGFDSRTGKRIRKFKTGFKTQREAQMWQLQIQADFGKGAISTNSTMTFKKFLDDYFIPDYKSQVRKRTFDMSQSKFKRLSYFENMKLSDILPPHVKQWQNSMFIEGLSNNYIRSVHQILQQVFDLAVKLGMLSNNVAKTVGNVKKDRPKVDFWTVEEFQLFISTFLIDCSMYYKNQKEWYLTDTKSISGVRLLYLDDDTLEHLKYWKKAQSQIGECKFVFSIADSPLVKSTLKRVLKSHSDYAKIKSIRIHDLRHSHASFMLSLGMNDLEMQNRLGHADIKTTLGTYSHLRPNAMKEVATRMTGKVVVSDNIVRKSKFNGNQNTKNFQSKVLSD